MTKILFLYWSIISQLW